MARPYYGWFIVFIAALGVFFSGPGQTYSNAAFIDEYIRDFGWSRSEVSGIYSAATLLAGFIMMVVGRFIDRYGQRVMMVTIGTLLAVACFWNSSVSSIWMLAVGFFFIRLLGQGSMSLMPNTLVAQWFIKKRGVAFSLMSLGGFSSAMLFPVMNTWLINTWDWRLAWQVWGILLLIIFVPIAWFGVRNRPEDIGLVPDGPLPVISGKRGEKSEDEQSESKRSEKHEKGEDPSLKRGLLGNRSKRTAKGDHGLRERRRQGGMDEQSVEEDWTLAEARRTRAFWAILICVAIPAMVNTGITFHMTSIMGANGLTPAVAAMVLSLMALVGIPMSLVFGYVTDRVRANVLLGLIFVIEMILLLMLLVTKSLWTAVLFGIVWGVANGIERITLSVIWPNYFGRRHIGSINSVGMTMMVIGSSLGPLPFGVGFDLFGNYTAVLFVSMIFPLLGLLSAALATKPVKSTA